MIMVEHDNLYCFDILFDDLPFPSKEQLITTEDVLTSFGDWNKPLYLNSEIVDLFNEDFGDNWTYYFILHEHGNHYSPTTKPYWTRLGITFVFYDKSNALRFKLSDYLTKYME